MHMSDSLIEAAERKPHASEAFDVAQLGVDGTHCLGLVEVAHEANMYGLDWQIGDYFYYLAKPVAIKKYDI